MRIRSLKDMRCEFETPSPQYCGDALILGYISFNKSMIQYCGKEFFIRIFTSAIIIFVGLKLVVVENCLLPLQNICLKDVEKTLENILKKIWKSWIIKYLFDRTNC